MPAKKYVWQGISEHRRGEADTEDDCRLAASRAGSSKCDISLNPKYVEEVTAALADRAVDLKAVILSWNSENHVNLPGYVEPTFVQLARDLI